MRKTVVGIAVAAIVGASLLLLPSAFAAAPHSSAKTTSTAKAKSAAKPAPAVNTAKAKPDSDDGDDDGDNDGDDHGEHNCHYPTRHRRSVTLTPRNTVFHGKHVIVFSGTVRGNRCHQAHVEIDLFNKTQGRIVISGHTDSQGHYSLIIKPQGTFDYVSRAKPDKRYYTAYSNTAHVTVKPRKP